jgi:hypothetical protein
MGFFTDGFGAVLGNVLRLFLFGTSVSSKALTSFFYLQDPPFAPSACCTISLVRGGIKGQINVVPLRAQLRFAAQECRASSKHHRTQFLQRWQANYPPGRKPPWTDTSFAAFGWHEAAL